MRVLFSASERDWQAFRPPLERKAAEVGLHMELTREADPASTDYIVYAPGGPVEDFAPFTGLKAVLSLWAGVERIVGNPTLHAPLCRMVDQGLTEGMVEYVAGHVLRYHLGMDAHLGQQDGVWRNALVPPLARERRVGVLGLGALGRAAAEMLAALRFRTLGWSRRAASVPGVETHSGDGGLEAVLRAAEILVLLLPATPATRSLLDARRLGLLPRGARILNPARGTLIDDEALLRALDSGQVAHATLDVFRTEPLPPDHPFWAHPRVTVTPHIAAATRPDSAAEHIIGNILRGEAGEPLLNQVDRTAGY